MIDVSERLAGFTTDDSDPGPEVSELEVEGHAATGRIEDDLGGLYDALSGVPR
jgi:hypothetical protein